jgi:hypothetical protein
MGSPVITTWCFPCIEQTLASGLCTWCGSIMCMAEGDHVFYHLLLCGRWRVITARVSYTPFCGTHNSKCTTCFLEILKAPVFVLCWGGGGGSHDSRPDVLRSDRSLYTRNPKISGLWINIVALCGLLYCDSMGTRYTIRHSCPLVGASCFPVNGHTWA